MSMRVQVINSTVEPGVAKNGKSYEKMVVTFKNLATNKIEAKTLTSYGNKDVWNTLLSGAGQTYQVDTEKDNAGYWQWVALHRDDGPVDTPAAVPPPPGANKVRSTYEVNNEIQAIRLEREEKRQPLIVRQSCLSSAAATVGPKGDPAAVLKVAQQYYDWVYQTGVAGLVEDDIPA